MFILSIFQIIIAILLIICILIQHRGTSLGGAFGGGGESFYAKRGAEKVIFNFAIVLAILFLIVNFLSFIIK